jgi:hypothetical protein
MRNLTSGLTTSGYRRVNNGVGVMEGCGAKLELQGCGVGVMELVWREWRTPTAAMELVWREWRTPMAAMD